MDGLVPSLIARLGSSPVLGLVPLLMAGLVPLVIAGLVPLTTVGLVTLVVAGLAPLVVAGLVPLPTARLVVGGFNAMAAEKGVSDLIGKIDVVVAECWD